MFTESNNVTADLLFQRFGHSAFRLNSNLWRDYSLILQPDRWAISNPVGLKITSETATHAIWWKPWLLANTADDSYVIGEVKYVFRELYAWFLRHGLILGNPPDFHNKFGKLAILDIASRHFRVPSESIVAWNAPLPIERCVAKSLSSEGTNDGRILYTATVDPRRIDPSFPWFLQTHIDAVNDVTVVVCDRQFFAFGRSRKDLAGLDWRQFIPDEDPENPSWHVRALDDNEHAALRGFCNELGIQWGRLDFLEDEHGLVFLEYNANGQWAWLDIHDTNGLMKAVVSYLLTPPMGYHREERENANSNSANADDAGFPTGHTATTRRDIRPSLADPNL